ncbi:MAG: hypothetical protein ABIQ05_05210 [Candidatus Limnocylindria bacterium]
MPRRSAEPRYRRRVVLELTPDESGLLDGLAEHYGTIRGAVLAGLRELEADRSTDLEAQLRDLTDRLATAEQSAAAEHDRLATELAATKEQLATSRKELKAAQAERTAARADLGTAKAKLTEQGNARRAAENQRRAVEQQLIHHVHCAACDRMVPDTEWAEQPAERGVYVYHRPDGFREKNSFLGQPATVLFWRPASTAAAER